MVSPINSNLECRQIIRESRQILCSIFEPYRSVNISQLERMEYLDK